MRSKATWLLVVALGAVVVAGVVDSVRGSTSKPETTQVGEAGIESSTTAVPSEQPASEAVTPTDSGGTTERVDTTAAARIRHHPSTCPRATPNSSSSPSRVRAALPQPYFVASRGLHANMAGRPSRFRLTIRPVTGWLSLAFPVRHRRPISRTDSSSSWRSPPCPATGTGHSLWSRQSALTWFSAHCPARTCPATTVST